MHSTKDKRQRQKQTKRPCFGKSRERSNKEGGGKGGRESKAGGEAMKREGNEATISRTVTEQTRVHQPGCLVWALALAVFSFGVVLVLFVRMWGRFCRLSRPFSVCPLQTLGWNQVALLVHCYHCCRCSQVVDCSKRWEGGRCVCMCVCFRLTQSHTHAYARTQTHSHTHSLALC